MIKLEKHDSIKCTSELSLKEKRYILFNGKITIAEILEINAKWIKVELDKAFSIRVGNTSIYREKPQLQ